LNEFSTVFSRESRRLQLVKDVCAAAAAADSMLTPPPPVMTDRRAAAADNMAASRWRHFRDVYIFVYSFLEFLTTVDNQYPM